MTLLLEVAARVAPEVVALQPRLGFSGSGIADFRTTVGGPDRHATVTVVNIGNGSLGTITLGTPTYASGTPGWLVASYDPNTGQISLTAASSGMPEGFHEAFLPVSGSLAVNGTQQLYLPFRVDPALTSQLTLTPSTLSIGAQQGGPNPAQQTSLISNTGGGGSLGTLSIGSIRTIAGSQPYTAWLTASIVGSQVRVDRVTGSLTELGGPYAAEVEIIASGAPNSPQILTVFFVITSATSSATYLGANLPVGDQQIVFNPVTKNFDNTVMITGGEAFTGTVHTPADATALRLLLNANPRIIQNGDQIRLTPGVNYDSTTGSPINWCAGLTNYVALQTGTLSGFNPRGTRISGTENYATLRTSTLGGSGSGALAVPGGRGYLWARGVRFTQHPSQTQGSRLVTIGNEPPTSSAGLAHRCVFERCFFDVAPGRDSPSQLMRGCMDMEGKYIAVEDSIAKTFHAGQDAYTFRAIDGKGPFKFINVELMSSCVGWLTGGDIMHIVGTDSGGPENWEMRRCYSHKDPTKKGVSQAGFLWNAKNLGEFKNMRRALITDMRFQYHWGQGQIGHFLAFTNYDGGGTAPNADEYMTDVVVAYCHTSDVGAGVQYLNSNQQSNRHGRNVLSHLLLERINIPPMTVVSGTQPRMTHLQRPSGKSQMLGITIRNLTIDCPSAHSFMLVDGANAPISSPADVQNNVCHHGSFGFFFTFFSSNPAAAIAAAFPTNTWNKNILLAAGNPAVWPNGGTTPSAGTAVNVTPSAVFTLYPPSTSDGYTVPTTSGYNNWGSNGEDPGCDVATVLVKTAHCIDGNWN